MNNEDKYKGLLIRVCDLTCGFHDDEDPKDLYYRLHAIDFALKEFKAENENLGLMDQ